MGDPVGTVEEYAVSAAVIDFSQLSNEEIQARLAQQRKDLNTLNMLVKERGISNNEVKRSTGVVRAAEQVGRAERLALQATERLQAARQNQEDVLKNFLTARKVDALPEDIQAECDRAYELAKNPPPKPAKEAEAAESDPTEAPVEDLSEATAE